MVINNEPLVHLQTCWVLPKTGEVVIGNNSNDPSQPDMGHVIFNINDYLSKVEDFKNSNATLDRDETIVAGWNSEYHGALQEIDKIRNNASLSKEQKKAAYAGIIRPEPYQNIQMAATNVAVFRPIIRQHGLLQTVQTKSVNDLNGIEFLKIDPIDQHVVQEDLKFANQPYSVSNFGISTSTMNVKRFGYGWSVSEELRLTKMKLDVESEILSQLSGVLELHKNEWIASIINGISGTAKNDWTDITSGAYTYHAKDDMVTPLDAINAQNESPPANIYSIEAVADAYLYNVGATQPPGLQQLIRKPYSYGNGALQNVPLLPGMTWTYDNLLTGSGGRVIVTSADAITHLTGPQKLVNYTNKDQSEFGTMIKSYYNIEITRAELISAITGVTG
ncbi:MAG: hypothetical protein R2685_10840 [Candidatus Nitrosocosmicus sp.]|nr:hypothetical protein [Candidatus Nitrosocosmicus sp.]